MTHFPSDLTHPEKCRGCQSSPPLDFDFNFAFQPIVDISTRQLFAHEALVRGTAGEGALSILERVNDDNRYRFDQRCRTQAIAEAMQLGMDTYLSINFLPNAVYRPELCIRSTLEAARQHNFPLDKLIFETLESDHMRDSKHLMHILRQYQEFGFKTAIDDFGAGHSGLTLLADFQPDLIKLDMALIRGVDQDKARQAIVRGIIAICRDLDIQVIAEGIETPGERDFLADSGIALMQGYLFARPLFKGLPAIAEAAWPATSQTR